MKIIYWKQIEGFPKYMISTDGRVQTIKTGRILRPGVVNGYLQVGLRNNGNVRKHLIHRLVALAFISNPNNRSDVNHKDEDKTNNWVGNLEWCTKKYNNNYGTRNERSAAARSKPVLQFSREGQFVKEWPSSMEAARQLGINQGPISNCRTGKRPTAYNFVFKYKEWGN